MSYCPLFLLKGNLQFRPKTITLRSAVWQELDPSGASTLKNQILTHQWYRTSRKIILKIILLISKQKSQKWHKLLWGCLVFCNNTFYRKNKTLSHFIFHFIWYSQPFQVSTIIPSLENGNEDEITCWTFQIICDGTKMVPQYSDVLFHDLLVLPPGHPPARTPVTSWSPTTTLSFELASI